MSKVQAQRGVTDFKVVCDESNNTAEIVNNNQFVGDIYVKPSRSINFSALRPFSETTAFPPATYGNRLLKNLK